MKQKEKPIKAICKKFTNKDNNEYRCLYLWDWEFLLFPDNLFWSKNLKLDSYQKGQILISYLNDDKVTDYSKMGGWVKKSDYIEMRIKGKGIFRLFNSNEVDVLIYEMEPVNELERITLEMLKQNK